MQERVQYIDAQLRDRFEKRGQLAEQLKAASEDRRMGEKQIELRTLRKELDEAVGRWRILATAGRVLDSIKDVYESERQPETLQEASGYLQRMTEGRYIRVWTPLGREELLVDDASGNPLPVEALSRGTREQLFLSLRLALVSSYGRRGAPLPLILDDVLVNFDAHRAKAAAEVLRDFAKAGHQVLVFTCHDHIAGLFRALDASVDLLPSRGVAAKPKPRRAKPEPRPAPPQPVVPVVEEEPEPEFEETPEGEEAEFEVPTWQIAEVHDVEEEPEEVLEEEDYEDEPEEEDFEYEEVDDEGEKEDGEEEEDDAYEEEEYEYEDEEEYDDEEDEEDELEPEEEDEEGYRWYESDEDAA